MEKLFDFLMNHGAAIITVLTCVIYFSLRFIKTGRSYDFLRWLLRVMDSFGPTADRKSGSGRHVSRSGHVD